ncbi:hypothetical protein NPIL_258581 [Nephila pilipes]|uniref:Uncharacterized protein n=1 Tax=Nephila pilipes TaxID=299642 RepID=A0A8X6QJJ6_NEPPI|nr:hypothetical protein NPIL_258581 [Nephila pilipes]
MSAITCYVVTHAQNKISHYRLQCWHINGLNLSLNRTLKFRNHFGILRTNFNIKISPQKPITWIEVWRTRRPFNVHSCAIQITQKNQTILKVLFQQSKNVVGAMWSSAILHKLYEIKFGITDHEATTAMFSR